MFKLALTESNDLTIDTQITDIGRGCWHEGYSDVMNYTYAYDGFGGEDRITIFFNPTRSGYEAVMVMQRPDSPLVMCRITTVTLDELQASINSTLAGWENF